jgi:peptidoglycan/xylan/chitin deacetylase (PgdA/CDA1 family)/GT2 family glycosyltransferase
MDTGRVSIVIPSIGDAALLGPCLNNLSRQTAECTIEVLVVLDGEAAGRSENMRQLVSRTDWPWSLRWIVQPVRGGAGAARNLGVASAGGAYLIFLDEDMIASSGLVSAHIRLLSQNPNTVVIGAIKTRCIGYANAYRYFVERSWDRRHQRLTSKPQTNFLDCLSGNLAMLTEAFRLVGGFDETVEANEDLDLGVRLEREGLQLVYGEHAQCIQQYRKSPSQMMRDCETRGAAAIALWRKYPEARRTIRFTFSPDGLGQSRWVRKRALASRWRWESMASMLPWMPGSNLTASPGWFFYDLAGSRGARQELADESAWVALSEGTLLLSYHRFCNAGEGRTRQVMPIDQFARQINFLQTAGYRFITTRDLIGAWEQGKLIGGRTVVLTFDASTKDLAEVVAPLLRRKGIVAVLNIVSNWIEKPGFLNADEIKMLAKDGWEIGSQSLSHRRLSSLTEDLKRHEIADSRSQLAEITGAAPQTFAYPYGDCDVTSQSLVKEAGYTVALGSDAGFAYPHTSQWNLPRFSIDCRWPLWRFKLMLSGASSRQAL